MTRTAITLIYLYKKLAYVFREARLPFYIHTDCRYYPTCSDFAVESICRYGVVKGTARSFLRILKCSPFSGGRADIL